MAETKENSARFKNDPEINNLIFVQRKEEVEVSEVAVENNPGEEGNIVEPTVDNDEEEQVAVDVEVVENVLIHNDEEVSEKDKELNDIFIQNMKTRTILL